MGQWKKRRQQERPLKTPDSPSTGGLQTGTLPARNKQGQCIKKPGAATQPKTRLYAGHGEEIRQRLDPAQPLPDVRIVAE
jgi:hypothetical protein